MHNMFNAFANSRFQKSGGAPVRGFRGARGTGRRTQKGARIFPVR